MLFKAACGLQDEAAADARATDQLRIELATSETQLVAHKTQCDVLQQQRQNALVQSCFWPAPECAAECVKVLLTTGEMY